MWFKERQKAKRKKSWFWAATAGLLFMLLVGSLSGALAQVNQPVKVIVHGVQVASDVPAIIMGQRVFMPDLFVSEILGYPLEWNPKNRSVTVGVPAAGISLASKMPAYTGKPLKSPVKIEGKSYAQGYELTKNEAVRWNLKGLFDQLTFGFGLPDNQRTSKAGFTVWLDGKALAQETVTKNDGLKSFRFNVTDGQILTLKYYQEPGGIIINPVASQVAEEEPAEKVTPPEEEEEIEPEISIK
jgi:hypothetical protein